MQVLDEYTKLKENLPHGALKRIATKHKVPGSYITRILRGDVENIKILTDILVEAEAYKKYKDDLKRRIEAL